MRLDNVKKHSTYKELHGNELPLMLKLLHQLAKSIFVVGFNAHTLAFLSLSLLVNFNSTVLHSGFI